MSNNKIFAFTLIGTITCYFYYKINKLEKQIKNIDNKIDKVHNNILYILNEININKDINSNNELVDGWYYNIN